MPSPITRRPRGRHVRAALSALWIAGAIPAMSGLVMPGEADAATTPSLSSPAPDLNASARAEVAQALFAASATSAAAERAADARLTQQRRQIEQLQAQLKTAGGRNATLLADLTRAQERFVEQLAERDRAYAQSIAVFRRAVQDIAATPEGEAALRQFNAGDEVGALAALDRIVDARERARKVQADIETAVERRRVATLALEAMGKGKQQAGDVIRRFEEVTRLDPGLHWDWVELARLYDTAGRLPDARRAAQRAAETAGSDRDLSVAMNELGDVLVAQGDLPGARARFQEGLEIRRKLAAADPSSASLQRDLIVSYVKLGEVFKDRRYAQQALDVALAMRQRGILAPRDAWMIDELKRRAGP